MKMITSLPQDQEEECECERCAEPFPASQLVIYEGHQLCVDCVIDLRGEGE